MFGNTKLILFDWQKH